MHVTLPQGQWADIKDASAVTERTARAISRAYLRAAATAAKLTNLGFDETKPETWGLYAEISADDQASLDGYQAELIVGLVTAWSYGDLPTLDSVLDLPKPVFDELAKACSDEFNQSAVDTEPSPDPLASTADSPS